jgi:hypothetical protein
MPHLRRGKAAVQRRRETALAEVEHRVKMAGFAGEFDPPRTNPADREIRLHRAITERNTLTSRI